MSLVLTSLQPRTSGAQSFLARPTQRMLIGGEWQGAASGETLQTLNPATGEVLGQIPAGAEADIDRAVAAARRALNDPAWRELTPAALARLLWRMAELLEANLDELAELESLDNGKPLWVGKYAEIPGAIEQFRYFAGVATRIEGTTIPTSINYQPPGKKIFAYTVKEPIGVVGAIVPWNSPIVLTAMKIAPALAAGCTMVLKPAEDTSLTAIRLAELMVEAGFPPGVFNLVTGLGERAGAALAAHAGVDKIAFTGSTEVGKRIAASCATRRRKVTLELGGKGPHVVFADAAIDQAVEGIVSGIWFNQGQVCCAGSRLLVEESVLEEVVEKLRHRMRSIRVGDPLDKNTDLGAINSRAQLERIRHYLRRGEEEGAVLHESGDAALPDRGFWCRPTLFTNVQPTHAIAREEIFGPVLVAMSFRTAEEAVSRANNTPYGLSAGVWSDKGAKALEFARRMKAGVVWCNTFNRFDPASPFGGYRESGFGREGGVAGLREYLA